MIKLLRRSKLFIFLIILINTSSLIATQIPNTPSVTIITDSDFQKDNIFSKLFNEDGLLSYDAVISFLDDLENERIEVSSQEDLDKIIRFVTYLAKQGIMPDTPDEEKAEIEKDIEELLNSNKEAAIYQNALNDINNYQIIPCIFYGKQAEIVYCGGWVKKQIKHVGKFVHKHKTAVIVASVFVVGAVAVVATVAIAGSTAVASAAAATAADAWRSKEEKKEEKSSSNESNTVLNNNPADLPYPSLQKTFDNQLSNLKDSAIENNLQLNPETQNPLYTDNRIIGSVLAHDAINNIPQNMPNKKQDLMVQGHGKIDNAFSTYQTPFYADYNKLFNGPENLQENIFYFQGQEALKTKSYDQAIDNFDKALTINPNNQDIYLNRAYAYLEKGDFDQSLNDFNAYNQQKNQQPEKSSKLNNCIDFSVGFSKGITKGAFESGKQLLSFAGQAITHPIETSSGIYEAFSNLASFTKSQEWKALSKTLAPEACELINKWETLSPSERGEQTGYIIGKYGADLLIPGAATKVIAEGINGAKELAIIVKNVQYTEKMMPLEALAGTSGRTEAFTDVINNIKIGREALPKASEIIEKIKNTSITTKNDILNVMKPKSIGISGSSDRIRLVQGGRNEAQQMFNILNKNGKLLENSYPGKLYILSDGTLVGYRPISTSGPATIEIKFSDSNNYIKIKFIENN
jgi:tetratricopeptide (TPR) repeat protein